MARGRSWCTSALAVCLLIGGSAAAAAQETRGSIEGTVKDSTGAGLPGATVEARSPSLVGVATAISDDTGGYRFPSLAPGVYEVSAAMPGFQTVKTERVRLELGQILKIPFSLAPSGISENVQVVAESPIIDVKQNAAVGSVTSELIERMPRGRDFASLVSSAPGANPETKSGGIQIDGASGSENRFVIDGLDTTNLRTGVSQVETLVDVIEEVQVQSSGYNAEYRATTGGVVSAITKSGSNAFHGTAGVYHSSNDWMGDVRPSLRLNPANQTLSEYTTTDRDAGFSTDPVFTLGGPILRNRVWFFAGYLPQIGRSERTVKFNSTGQTQTFPDDTDDHNVNYNVSSQLTSSTRFRFAANNQRSTGGNRTLPTKEPDGSSNSNASLFPSPFSTSSSSDSYSAEYSWVVSPRFFVKSNFGALRYNTTTETDTEFSTKLRHVFNASTNVCTSSSCPFPEIPASLQQLSAYADFPSSARTFNDNYGRIGASVDTTYYADFAGRHTFKGGIQFERLTNDAKTGSWAPTVNLNWNASRTTLDDQPRAVRGRYGYYTVFRSYTEGQIHSNNLGLFLQDAWTVNDRLTLNLGVRSDREDIPSYRPDNPGISFGFGDKFASRLGYAFDVKGDAKWKAYGSWGIFYDIQKLEMARGSFGADRWIDYHYTLDSFDWPAINCEGPPGSGCPGTFIEQADRRLPSNLPGDYRVDPDLDPVRTQEFTVGLDHELSRTMSVGVRYAHKWLNRLIEDVGIQVAGRGEVFMIANPGYRIAEFTLAGSCPSCPAQPKATRDYDGVEFRLRKRLSDRWSLNTSYTYSRLYGNTSGLASSDENGRTAPNVERAFDGMYMSFDQHGQPVFGRLQTDRPHQFELLGTYDLPWGTGIGVDHLLATGTPQQSAVNIKSVPFFDSGRGNMGRSPTFSKTDLAIYHDFRLGSSKRLNLSLNVFNVFDSDTVTRLFTTRYRDQLPLSDAAFFAGFDLQGVVNTLNTDNISNNNIRLDPRFGLADQWQGARSVRVQVKLLF